MQYEQPASAFSESGVTDKVVCGPNADRSIGRIRALADAGFDHIAHHQIGTAQQTFTDLFEREVLPSFR